MRQKLSYFFQNNNIFERWELRREGDGCNYGKIVNIRTNDDKYIYRNRDVRC